MTENGSPASKDLILQKAKELGELLHDTDVYKEFNIWTEKLEEDDDSKKLLDRYNQLANDLHAREVNGDIIEDFERESFKEIIEEIGENEILNTYVQTHAAYVNLLERIQNALQGRKEE